MSKFSGTMHRMRRTAVVGAALAIIPSLASAETTLRVGKSVGPAFAEAPIDVGIEYGLFKKQGLDIELTSFGSGDNLAQAMVGGSTDIGITAAPEMTLTLKGAPFKGIAVLGVAPYDLVIIVNKDGAIKTVADLKGKQIAVTGVHSLTAWLTTTLSQLQGWGRDGIQAVSGNSQAGHVAMMRTHEIDGAVSDISLGYDLETKNQGRILLKFGDYVPNLATDVITATDIVLAKQPEAVRAFLRGWLDTINFIYTQRDKTIPVFAKVTNRPVAVAAAAYDAVMPTGFFSRDGRFDAKMIGPLAKAFVDMGLVDQPPDMSKLYTEAFLPTR